MHSNLSPANHSHRALAVYERRSYREEFCRDLSWFQVCVDETDLMVGCSIPLEKETMRMVRKIRAIIREHIRLNPCFATSLVPLVCKGETGIIREMMEAGQRAGTGPMAAVAGAISMAVAIRLHEFSEEVFVENGGDIYLFSGKDRIVGIRAGRSPIGNSLAVRIRKEWMPMGICTSSGTVGHSFSFGKADAVTILSRDNSLCDAVATAACNRIKDQKDIPGALEWAMSLKGIQGILAVMGDKIGAAGSIELAPGIQLKD